MAEALASLLRLEAMCLPPCPSQLQALQEGAGTPQPAVCAPDRHSHSAWPFLGAWDGVPGPAHLPCGLNTGSGQLLARQLMVQCTQASEWL